MDNIPQCFTHLLTCCITSIVLHQAICPGLRITYTVKCIDPHKVQRGCNYNNLEEIRPDNWLEGKYSNRA